LKLSAMRYKDYVWPHNPRSYEISFQRDVAAYRVPYGTYLLESMGRRHRVLRGTGEFVGEGAYEEFRKLALVFYEPGPGVLVHPLWDTTQAYFVSLRLNQEPTEDYVSYSFEFWESHDGYRKTLEPVSGSGGAAGSDPVYHTAVAGEVLWRVAADHGLTLPALLAMNPQIKNPNVLCVGDRIRVG